MALKVREVRKRVLVGRNHEMKDLERGAVVQGAAGVTVWYRGVEGLLSTWGKQDGRLTGTLSYTHDGVFKNLDLSF